MNGTLQIVRPKFDYSDANKDTVLERVGTVSRVHFADLGQDVYQIELDGDCDLSEVIIVPTVEDCFLKRKVTDVTNVPKALK